MGFDDPELILRRQARLPLPAPLVSPAIAVAVGIFIARTNVLPPFVFVAGLIMVLAASGILLGYPSKGTKGLRWGKKTTFVICLAFAFLAGLRYCLVYSFYPNDHIIRFCTPKDQLVTLQGRIVTTPFITQSSGAFSKFDFIHEPRTIFTLECEKILTSKGWSETSGLTSVVVTQPAPLLQWDQQITVHGVIKLPAGPDNPGQFDYRDARHADRKPVVCYVNMPEAIDITRSEPESNRIHYFQRKLQSLIYTALIENDDLPEEDGQEFAVRRTFGQGEDKDVQAFLAALVLGRRHALPGPLNELFIRTGTIHFLSVSGLHVGLFASLAWGLGRLLRLGRKSQGILALLAVLLYLVVIPPRPPVIRAGIMCIVFCIAYLMRRRTNPVNLLAAAAIIILLMRPLDLFNPGFQLSFIVVLGILIFVPAIFRHQMWPDNDDIDIQKPEENHSAWGIFARTLWKVFIQLFAVAAVAWLVGMPLTAWQFNRVAVWAAPASVLMAPLIALTLWLAVGKILLSVLLPQTAIWLYHPLEFISRITIQLNDFFARLPGSGLNTASPPWMLLVIFYGILIAAAVIVYRGKVVPKFLLAALVLWEIGFVWLMPFRFDTGQTTVDVLDVGHGGAVVVQLPDRRVICYDAGSLSRFDAARRIIMPFLRSRGINQVDALFISHANIDHYNGVIDLCRDFRVQHVYTSEYFEPSADRAAKYLLNELQTLNQSVRIIGRGEQLLLNENRQGPYTIRILWPSPTSEAVELNTNDTSLVVRISDANGSILLCGDFGIIPQKMMLEQESPEQLKSDVLQLPHHGSIKSLLPEFLAAVDPVICVNSASASRLPDRDKLSMLTGTREVYHTGEQGAIHVVLSPTGLDIQPFQSH